MAFDPLKYGATPVTQGFDPTKYGATPTQPQQAAQPSFADSIWNSLAGIGKNIGSDIQSAGNDVNAAISGTGQYQGQGPWQRGFSAASSAANAIPSVAADLIPGGKTALGALGSGFNAAINAPSQLSSGIASAAQRLGGASDQQLRQNDISAGNFANSPLGNRIGVAASIGQSAGNVANTILGAQGVASAGDAAVNAIRDIRSTSSGAQSIATEGKPAPTPEQSTSQMAGESGKIIDKIMPKPNAAEIKLALDEGRIAPGQDPTFLRDGTPDSILPSEKVGRAAETIRTQIPGAGDMPTSDLYTALDKRVSQIGTQLRPQMEATPITEDIVSKITNDWTALKVKQLADPYTPTGANLEKLQANFEQNFLQASKADNLSNLWDTRIKYDNSVPPSVKNATSLSSDVLQSQKSIWLQNRSILNNAINDAASGLGKISQEAFSNMSDLYNAQKGIRSSYTIPKTGASSGVSKFLKTPAGKAVKVGAGIVGAGTLLKAGESL